MDRVTEKTLCDEKGQEIVFTLKESEEIIIALRNSKNFSNAIHVPVNYFMETSDN